MRYSLQTKLVLSFVSVAMICVGLISIFSNVLLEKHFRDYVIENQERKNKEIISLLRQQYQKDQQWKLDKVSDIGIHALERGLIVKISDEKGKVIWDAMEYNNGMCEQMLTNMANNMDSRYPNWEGGYTEADYAVIFNEKEIGRVKVGYYGPFYFNDNDLAFINTLNQVFVSVGVVSLALAFIIGLVISKRLSRPISRVIATTKMIAKGYFGDRVHEKSNTKDISDLTSTINDLAETLENQEKLRKRLTGDVAHELRTPLATLQGHMEAMIDGIWQPDVERLKSCHEEILRINRMVGDLEKLAKYESDNIILQKERFDMVELITRTLCNFENDFKSKQVELSIENSSSHAFINADKDKISQVIVNLLSNALKYTNAGGKVTIHILDSDDSVEFSIVDNGIGISEQDIPFIFERFYRADKSRNRMTGGSGIGLTISKSIIDAHKGAIFVQSKVDAGTELYVSLPKEMQQT